jgi:hypothetical protein
VLTSWTSAAVALDRTAGTKLSHRTLRYNSNSH